MELLALVLEVKGQKIELSLEEAKKLKESLDLVFKDQSQPILVPYQVPGTAAPYFYPNVVWC